MRTKKRDTSLIAQRIRQLRKVLGFKQEDFAQRLGLDQTTVSKWETGKARPTPDAFVKLASVAEGAEKLAFLEEAGVPEEFLDGRKMLPEIHSAAAAVVARALGTKRAAPKESGTDYVWDEDLMLFAIEAVTIELKKRRRVLPPQKLAQMIVLFYKFCQETGRRNADKVAEFLKIA